MKDPLIERGLPANPEAERACIGAVMLDNRVWDVIGQRLHDDDFSDDRNRRIWEAIKSLRRASPSIPVDYTLLVNRLLDTGELDKIGGMTYLSSLTDGLPRVVNAEHYARIVEDKAVLRRLIHTSDNIAQQAIDGAWSEGEENARDGLAAFLGRAESAILRVRRKEATGLTRVRDIVPSLRGQRKPLGVSTGFPSIDAKMACNGWAIGELSFILARTSHGKTSLMLNQAYLSAAAGIVTAIFSLETSKERLVDRMCCQRSGASLFKLMHGMLNSLEHDLIADARSEIEELPIFIDDTPGMTALDVVSRARRLKQEEGLGIVWGDFLRLLRDIPEIRGTTNDKVAETVTVLKRGAQELCCPFVWLSQIGRFASDKKSRTPEPPPSISDARDCGEIENQAYTMVGLYRQDQAMKMVDPQWVKNGEAQFELLKDKDGPCGTVPLRFAGASMNFTEL